MRETPKSPRWCVVSDFRCVGGRYEIGPKLVYRAVQKDVKGLIAEWRYANGMASVVRIGRTYILGPEIPDPKRPTLQLVRAERITDTMLSLAAESTAQLAV